MEPVSIDLKLYEEVLNLPAGKRGVFDDPSALGRLREHLLEYHGLKTGGL